MAVLFKTMRQAYHIIEDKFTLNIFKIKKARFIIIIVLFIKSSMTFKALNY